VATHRTRSIRTAVAVVCAAVVAVGLLPGVGTAQPKPTLAQVTRQIDSLNTQAEAAQERFNNDQVAVAAAQRVLDRINARMTKAEAAVSAAQVSVGRMASAAYRSGGIDQTLQLLLADNPTQFLNQASALDSVSRRQGDVLRTVAAAQNRLAQDKLAAAQELGQIQALRDNAAKAYQDVLGEQHAVQILFNSLTAAQQAQIQAARAAAAAAQRALAQRESSTQRVSRHGGHITYGGTGIGARVVAFAMAHLGDPYVYGASGMYAWDCSGLTMRAYGSVGIYLPHSAAAQFYGGRQISASQLQPGDLVFYYWPIHHVGIYIGGGMIVNAENPGTGVVTTSLYSMPFSGAARPY
jgi:cell wall-associated NlpC family hydrolase